MAIFNVNGNLVLECDICGRSVAKKNGVAEVDSISFPTGWTQRFRCTYCSRCRQILSPGPTADLIDWDSYIAEIVAQGLQPPREVPYY